MSALLVTQPRLYSYDVLRIWAVCAVVAIHTFGMFAIAPALDGSPTDIAATVLTNGSVWAVPVFVMLSGALTLSESAHRAGPGAFYARRATRILPALVVWTFVYLVLIRLMLLGEPLSKVQIATDLYDARVYPHLYFLWLIAGLYLIAPVLRSFLNEGGTRRALITAAVALGGTVLVFMGPSLLALWGVDRDIQPSALTFWLPYVGYFLAGYALSVRRPSPAVRVAAGIVAAIVFAFVIAQFLAPEAFRVASAISNLGYQGLSAAVLSVAIFVLVTPWRPNPGARTSRLLVELSEASFGVFLVHFVVLLVPYALLPGFRETTSFAEAVLAYAVIVIVSFAVSLLARRIPGVRRVF